MSYFNRVLKAKNYKEINDICTYDDKSMIEIENYKFFNRGVLAYMLDKSLFRINCLPSINRLLYYIIKENLWFMTFTYNHDQLMKFIDNVTSCHEVINTDIFFDDATDCLRAGFQ
jgi:hypothetical protein